MTWQATSTRHLSGRSMIRNVSHALAGVLSLCGVAIVLMSWEGSILLALPLPWFGGVAAGAIVAMHRSTRPLPRRVRLVVLVVSYATAITGTVASVVQWVVWGIAFDQSETPAGVSTAVDRTSVISLATMTGSLAVLIPLALFGVAFTYQRGELAKDHLLRQLEASGHHHPPAVHPPA